jgi:hypothetical protein
MRRRPWREAIGLHANFCSIHAAHEPAASLGIVSQQDDRLTIEMRPLIQPFEDSGCASVQDGRLSSGERWRWQLRCLWRQWRTRRLRRGQGQLRRLMQWWRMRRWRRSSSHHQPHLLLDRRLLRRRQRRGGLVQRRGRKDRTR